MTLTPLSERARRVLSKERYFSLSPTPKTSRISEFFTTRGKERFFEILRFNESNCPAAFTDASWRETSKAAFLKSFLKPPKKHTTLSANWEKGKTKKLKKNFRARL